MGFPVMNGPVQGGWSGLTLSRKWARIHPKGENRRARMRQERRSSGGLRDGMAGNRGPGAYRPAGLVELHELPAGLVELHELPAARFGFSERAAGNGPYLR
jgi:hypothetical protein